MKASATAASQQSAPLFGERAAILAVTVLGVIFGAHRLIDPDLFLQIAVGRSILAAPRSIGVSTFIDAFPAYAYVEDKWLASVMAALVDRLGGEHALMLYQIGLSATVALAWYVMQRTWLAGPGAALVGAALGLLTCSFRLEPRPDTMSHALLAVLLAVLAAGSPASRLRWIVPGLLLVWVNLHGYFVNGLLVLVAVAVTSLVGDRDLPAEGSTPYPAARDRVVLLGLALVACVAHPQGWHATLAPAWQLLQLEVVPALRATIQELQPTSTLVADAGPTRFALLALSAAVAIAAGTMRWGRSPLQRQIVAAALAAPWVLWPPSGLTSLPFRVSTALWIMAAVEAAALVRDRRLLRPLLLFGFTVLAVPMVRNVPLLTPVALILLAPSWTMAAHELALRFPRAAIRQVAAVGVAALVVGVAWLRLADRLGTDVRAPIRTGWGLDRDRFPEGAIDALASPTAAPGAILNNFDVGGYVLYRLHPSHRAFIAGNTSMYPASFLAYYRANVTGAALQLPELTRTHGLTSAILDLASPAALRLATALVADPSWRLAYFDRGGAAFVRSDASPATPAVDVTARARQLAEATPALPVLPLWLGGQPLPYPRLNLGIFLLAIGRPDLALAEAARVWSVAPAEDAALLGGQAAQQAGRLLEFLPQLEHAARAYPGSDRLKHFLFLALAFRAERALASAATLADAERDLRRMLELEPENCGPYFALAKSLVLRGDARAAKRWAAEGQTRDRDGACGRMVKADPALASLLP